MFSLKSTYARLFDWIGLEESGFKIPMAFFQEAVALFPQPEDNTGTLVNETALRWRHAANLVARTETQLESDKKLFKLLSNEMQTIAEQIEKQAGSKFVTIEKPDTVHFFNDAGLLLECVSYYRSATSANTVHIDTLKHSLANRALRELSYHFGLPYDDRPPPKRFETRESLAFTKLLTSIREYSHAHPEIRNDPASRASFLSPKNTPL